MIIRAERKYDVVLAYGGDSSTQSHPLSKLGRRKNAELLRRLVNSEDKTASSSQRRVRFLFPQGLPPSPRCRKGDCFIQSCFILSFASQFDTKVMIERVFSLLFVCLLGSFVSSLLTGLA